MSDAFTKFIVSLLGDFFKGKSCEDFGAFESAFTHPSYKNKRPDSVDYERLEILGDSFITLIITEKLYSQGLPLKKISTFRKEIISGSSLGWLSKNLNFEKYIRIDGGCEISNSVLEDVYESFVGAAYLTVGYECAKKFVEDTLYVNYLNGNISLEIDYKTQLQEKIQSIFKENRLIYFLENKYKDQNGRDVFAVSVRLNGRILGRGEGYRKKAAEQKSAQDALIKLDRIY